MQGDDLYTFPTGEIRWANYDHAHMLVEGAYCETKLGWGKIVKVGHGSVVVSVFALREDPGKQDFPGYRVVDMDAVILDVEPYVSTFQSMLCELSNKRLDGIKMLWLEDELMPRLNVTYWDGEWAWVD